MITILNKSKEKPYEEFYYFLSKAKREAQKNIDALVISTFSKKTNEISSRFVNLKYIDSEEWIFFTNYNSVKSKDIMSNSKIAALIYWNNIDLQIRIKAEAFKTSSRISDNHYLSRDIKKNALAISSNQSQPINSYEDVQANYLKILESKNTSDRPEYWGGISFIPYYFEFWEGHENRINKRKVYQLDGNKWQVSMLQP